MPSYIVEIPGQGKFKVDSPTELSDAQAYRAATTMAPQKEAFQTEQPDTGFTGAAKASIEELKGQAAALAGRMGLTDVNEAEKYLLAQQEKAKQIFKPTEKGWTEEPVTKFKELLGGSLPYMAAPAAAAAAGTLLAPGAAVAGLGAGTLGALGAGTAQFTATNIGRQVEEGQKLSDTNLLAAGAAAVPQAALDTLSFKMMPGIGRIFGSVGKRLTEQEALDIAKRGILSSAGDLAIHGAKTAGIEGTTEAAQQFFERLQAGLQLTDEAARKEYYENFLGGAILGGAFGGAGRAYERAFPVKEAPPPPPAKEPITIDPEQYKRVLERDIPDGGVDLGKLTDEFRQAGIAEPEAYVQEAVDKGGLQSHTESVFAVQDKDGNTLFQSLNEEVAKKAADRLNAEAPDSARVTQQDSTRITKPTGYPANTEITEGLFDPSKFHIVAGNTILSPSSLTVDEAADKAERLNRIRKESIPEIEKEIKTLQDQVKKNTNEVDVMEAQGLANTPEYQALAQENLEANNGLNQRIADLNAKKADMQTPVMVRPAKVSDDGFTVMDKGNPIYHFPTREQAEEAMSAAPMAKPTDKLVQAKEELRQQLLPFMQQIGLGNTGLKIMDAIESGEGSGDGYYLNNLVAVSMQSRNPMATLRHEVIHALKELGAFTDKEWKTLERMAKQRWINQFLKQRKTAEGRSLYDVYQSIYQKDHGNLDGFDEYIAEEAIADAFKFFHANGVPVGILGRIYNKIKAFLEALGNSLAGLGFQTADQVFERVEAGKMRPTVKAEAKTEAKPRYSATIEGSGDKSPFDMKGVKIYNSQLEKIIKRIGDRIVGMKSDETIEDVRKAVEKLKDYAEEGKLGYQWYERSAKSVLDAFKGDKVLAEKFFQIIAITSANTEVAANLTKTYNAWKQFVNNKPIKAGTEAENKKIEDLLNFGIDWDGRKTNTFYTNLMEAMEGKDSGRSTIDIHMTRMIFGHDVPTDAQYELAENMVRMLATKVNVPPRQIQAASWVTQKAKKMFEDYRANGWKKDLNDKELREYVMERGLMDYAHLMTERGELPVSAEIQEPSPSIRARTEVVTGEAIPSVKGEMVQISELKYKDKNEFNDAIIKNDYVNKIAKILNLQSKIRTSEGTGGYALQISPNMIVRLVNFNPKVAKDDATLLSNAMSYVFQQDATPFFRADPSLLNKAQLGYSFKFAKDLTITKERKIYEALREELGDDAGFSKTKNNELTIINFRGEDGEPFLMNDASFADAMVRFRNKVNAIAPIEDSFIFGADSEYNFYDWSKESAANTAKALFGRIQAAREDSPNLQTGLDAVRESFRDEARNFLVSKGISPRFSISEAGAIDVDGIERSRTNSKGRPIASNDDDIRNFWRWFGDSVMVDDQHRPLVLYHGTAGDFEAFIAKEANAIFFTKNPKFAGKFALENAQRYQIDNYRDILSEDQIKKAKLIALRYIPRFEREEIGLTEKSPNAMFEDRPEFEDAILDQMPTRINTVPVYAKVEYLFDYKNAYNSKLVVDKVLNGRESITFKEPVGPLPKENWDRKKLMKAIHGDMTSEGGYWPLIENPEVMKAIRDIGFDGITMFEEGVKNYAAIESNKQIKSAVGNLGAFGERELTKEELERESKRAGYTVTPEEAKTRQKEGYTRYSLTSAAREFDQDEIKKDSSVKFKSRTKLIEMNIDDFLALATYGVDKNKEAGVEKALNSGNKLSDLPSLVAYQKDGKGDLVVDGNNDPSIKSSNNHEGRHRARALKKRGYTTMPVLLTTNIRWSEQQDPDKFDYIEDWPKNIVGYDGNTVKFNVTRNDADKPYKVSGERYSLTDDFVSTFGQNALDNINAKTYVRQEERLADQFANAVSPESFTKFRQRVLNKYESIERLSKRIAAIFGKHELLADTSAISAALSSDRASGITAEAFINGIPVYDKKKGYTYVTNMNGTVKGLIPILEPLMQKYKDPKILQLFQFYAGTKRGKRLLAEGREKNFDPSDIKLGQDLEVKYPEFKQAFKEYQTWNEGFVNFLVDTGVISKDMGDYWMKYSDYIPFYRQIDGENLNAPSIFQNLSGVKPSPELKGGGQIGDFLETVIQNSRAAVEQGMKNIAAQRIVRDLHRLNGSTPDMIRKLNPGEKHGTDTITIRENGQDVSYMVADPLLVESMKSLHNMGINTFWKWMAFPTKALRELVTRDPAFMLSNLVRDSLQSWMTSGVSMTPIVDTYKNFGQILLDKSPEARALKAAGIGTGYEFSGDRKASAKAVMEALKQRSGALSPKDLAMWPLKKVWDALEQGSNASDLATRAEIYKKTLAATGNEAEAIHQALEVMNFGRMGSSPMIQIISALVPFFNARLQGMDVLYRAGFGRMASANAQAQHKAFMIRAMTIAGLSLMYWAMARDTDEWKNASEETRDNYWIIGKVKIPIPFELGVLFKVIPERIAEYSFGNDTGDELMRSAVRNLVSTLKVVPVPQAALPLVEEAANYSFFTGEPIIGRGIEGIAPEYQSYASTSLMAQKLGKQLGISPVRIEHLLQGYTGSLGSYVGMAVDSIIRTEEDGVRPTMSLEQTPVLKRFFASDKSGGTIDAFFRLKKQVDEVVRTEHELLSRGNPDEYIKYMETNGKLLGMKELVSSIDKQMKQFRQMRRMVQFSGLSADDKRETLDNIREAEIAMTEQIKEIKKQFQ